MAGRLFNSLAIFVSLGIAAPALAQDWLGVHLDTQREEKMRRHQQDMVTDRPVQATSRTSAPSRTVPQADRQAAWSRNKAEYRRRMLRDGPAAADRWLDQQARASVTTRAAPATPTPQARANRKNCKKVRWVNRATPGFGGGPMTMSRVAVCAD